MNMNKLAVGVMVLALAGSAVKVIGDEATTKPSAPAPKHTRGSGLVKPYSLLTDLTDDQKAKLADIHKKEQEEAKKLQEQEKTDSLAVLTDDQKTELADAIAKDKAATEARHAKAELDKAAAQTPTTAPSENAAK